MYILLSIQLERPESAQSVILRQSIPSSRSLGKRHRSLSGSVSAARADGTVSRLPSTSRRKGIIPSAPIFVTSSGPSAVRSFHSSTVFHDSSSSRNRHPPPRTPEDAELRYYVERKAQLDQVSERKEIDGELMPDLSATIVTGDFPATVTPREEKVPVEVFVDGDGVHLHASGFVPPTPAVVHAETGVIVDGLSAATLEADDTFGLSGASDTSKGDEGMLKTEGGDEAKPAGKTPPTPPPSNADPAASFKRSLHSTPVLSTASSPASTPSPSTSPVAKPRAIHSTPARKDKAPRSPEDVELRYYVERKAQLDQVSERKQVDGELMPELSATIVTGEFPATVTPREEKVPKEVFVVEDGEGVHLHASGFVPPTPAAVHEEAGVVADGLSAATLSPDELLAPASATEGTSGDEGMSMTVDGDEVKPAGKTPPTAPPTSHAGSRPGFKQD
jgi:hypothetical protein